MTPDEQEELDRLCRAVIQEKDFAKLTEVLAKLDLSLLSGRLAMTPEDRELTNWLCRQIQEEQDPKRFSELVWQLDALLAMNDNARLGNSSRQ